MSKKLISFIVTIIICLNAHAQLDPTEIIDKFFENYEKKGSDLAMDELYATNPWTTRIQDAIDNAKNQIKRFDEDLVGPYYGYEHLVTKKLGDSYILHSYFLKFDRQFLRLTFQFYKPQDEWRLFSFEFDDNYDDEIEEAAKLYYTDLDN